MNQLAKAQQGAVLLISLILLLLLTVLALTAANRSTLQERMAANSQDANMAFQTAEAGRVATINAMASINPAFQNITPANTVIGTSIYCAQATLGKIILMSRDGRVFSNSLDVRKNTLETRAINISSRGSISSDSTCTSPLAWHDSGFVIPLFK
jgi:hypothetical protein